MPYTTYPEKKIKKLLRFFKKDLSALTVDEAKSAVEVKFTVGVFVHYGRLKGQVHTFEIWRKMRLHWQNIIFTIEIPVENFRLN
jgi:hypothetical protein